MTAIKKRVAITLPSICFIYLILLSGATCH
uniref:Uncharacterized protein n=1 Tax=Podoviridae sp. ctCmm1 TaxID=2825231 RepID=A0A8S5TUT0_9CAUD|nr:MAG TPA: hypothetical protein [Podoviridae sp. ctCmm1]DAR68091.1 MAG TPA: hypothetical protein [Caudoviricetes sp.]